MGFGYIPPHTHPRVRVANLRKLGDRESILRDPLIQVGEGTLQVSGSIATGDYLRYEGGGSVNVYDSNWNPKAELPVETRNFLMPQGEATVQVTVPDGAPRPWISTQFITRGKAIPLSANQETPQDHE